MSRPASAWLRTALREISNPERDLLLRLGPVVHLLQGLSGLFRLSLVLRPDRNSLSLKLAFREFGILVLINTLQLLGFSINQFYY